jgi:hypothetical protein
MLIIYETAISPEFSLRLVKVLYYPVRVFGLGPEKLKLQPVFFCQSQVAVKADGTVEIIFTFPVGN